MCLWKEKMENSNGSGKAGIIGGGHIFAEQAPCQTAL